MCDSLAQVSIGDKMAEKLAMNGNAPEFQTEDIVVFEHTFTEHDLQKIDTFLRLEKQTGTLRVDYFKGGKTRIRFTQGAGNKHVAI